MRVVHAIVHGFLSLSRSVLLWGVCSPSLAFFLFSLLRSREYVPYDGACSVLLVSSLFCKLVLHLFDLYITYI